MPGSPLTITKILSGISKTLSIANQAIPIYNQVKPMLKGSAKILDLFKNSNTLTPVAKKIQPQTNEINEKKIIHPSGPQFFI